MSAVVIKAKGRINWIRLAEVAGPAQGELIDAGGCESGACNLDI